MNATVPLTQEPSQMNGEIKLVELPLSWTIFTVVIMIIVLVLTIIGNIAVIAVQSNSNALRNVVNSHFLISLSIADLLVAFLVMPCALDVVNNGTWRCGQIWGKFNGFGNFLFCISSIMHLMMLSVDRYMAIARPLRYRMEMTKSRALVFCLCLWSYSAVWAFLPLFGVSSYECFIRYIGICKTEDWSKYGLNFAFAISVVSGTYGLALIAMVYIYFKIGRVIRDQVQRIEAAPKEWILQMKDKDAIMNAKSPIKRRKMTTKLSQHKGVATLLVVILAYLVCWSPFCIMIFVEIGTGKKVNGPYGILAMLAGFANSCCNPVIYSIKYRSFRLAVARMLGQKNLVTKLSLSQSVRDEDCMHSVITKRNERRFKQKEMSAM